MKALTQSLLLVAVLAACAEPRPETRTGSDPAGAESSTPESQSAELRVFTSDAAGFDTHSYWLDTGREVVVFDAQFTEALAARVIAQIRAKTSNPIRYLVITHPNPDKFNGAPAFKAVGAQIVSSERTARAIPGVHEYKKRFFVESAKMFTDATYPELASVDLTFSGDLELPLEGRTRVVLHELEHSGVSSTQTIAFLPDTNALVVGDLVHHRAHAWLEGGIVDGKPQPDIEAWKRALEELRAYEGATVYGGRGEPATVDAAVSAQAAYLDGMTRIVSQYIAQLTDAQSELSGPNAGRHYKELAALAARSYPQHALPYLIEYGVYGLALRLAAP